MLHLHFAQTVQAWLPLAILGEVIGNSPGKQNVAGVATIHHPLGQVDAGPGDIAAIVDITNFIDRPAVNAHAQEQLRMFS